MNIIRPTNTLQAARKIVFFVLGQDEDRNIGHVGCRFHRTQKDRPSAKTDPSQRATLAFDMPNRPSHSCSPSRISSMCDKLLLGVLFWHRSFKGGQSRAPLLQVRRLAF